LEFRKNSFILFRKIVKSFDDKVVLKSLSMDVLEGESTVIIGRSGAGKSVLIKCLLGLVAPDSGEIVVNGKSIEKESSSQREKRFHNTGVVFQSSALFDSLTVWENIVFRLLHTRSPKEARDIALHNLDEVGLPRTVAQLYPCELSGGMQRRVAIARAISTRPSLLIFDEPTAGLDPIFSAMISNLIRKCIKLLKATAITITHDIKSARTIGDKISMLCNGSMLWEGASGQLLKSTNPFVRQFVRGDTNGPITTVMH